MPTFLAPPLSFASRFRPRAGTPGRAAARGRTLALYGGIAAAHALAVFAATASARSLPPRGESTLAVEWLVEAPATPRAEPPAPVPQPPRRVTPQAVPAASAPVAPVAPAETPVAPPTPTANPAPPAPAESRAAATPPSPAPIEAPRFDADYLHNPVPDYPALARRFGEQGKVLLRVEVSAEGFARQVEVARSSGSPRLDAAALDAVRRWRFQPARQGAQTLAGWVQVPINFRLNP